MIYLTHFPVPPLSHFIEHFFFFEGYAPAFAKEKRLPDGAVELIINLKEEPKLLFDKEDFSQARVFKKSWISGQQQGFLIIDVAGESSMMGIRFRPGGAWPFFPFPMSELKDGVVELDLTWGREALFLQESLVEAPMPQQKFLLLEKFLQRRASRELTPNPYVEFAVEALKAPNEDFSIRRLTQKTGISHKHLIRTFDACVGIKPKMLARIFKFQKAIHLLEQRRNVKWTSLADDCGYFDQAHFIKEFQFFSGINPSSYFDKRGEYVNWLPVT
jgi:AraC-like DNA-binding protein